VYATEPIREISIYSALLIISIITLIPYLYINIIIDDLLMIRKGSIKSEPVLWALAIGSLIALLFQSFIIVWIALLFSGLLGIILLLSCVYGYIGLYFGRRWHKLSWRWGIWLTFPWFVGIIIMSDENLHQDALVLFNYLQIFSFINLFAACIGAFVGAAKSEKEANNTKEDEKEKGSTIPKL
jgi:hypothetical protein